MAHSSEILKERLAEAASYALLRRLAPVLRHNMAGILQPVSMMATMLEKRLQRPEPDLAVLAKNACSVNTLAREAAAAGVNLISWLSSREDTVVAIHTGVAEALGLLATEMSLRGINLVNETGQVEGMVLLSRIRGVFMASLLALTDGCDTAATVRLTTRSADAELLLKMHLLPGEGEAWGDMAGAYRKLEWDDVQALADVQGVGLTHAAEQVTLRFTV